MSRFLHPEISVPTARYQWPGEAENSYWHPIGEDQQGEPALSMLFGILSSILSRQ